LFSLKNKLILPYIIKIIFIFAEIIANFSIIIHKAHNMSIKTLSLKDIKAAFPSSPIIAQGEDFFILDIEFVMGNETFLTYPCRFGGLLCVYGMEGEFSLIIGMDSYLIQKDTFAVSLPGDIVRMKKLHPDENAKIIVMALSNEMLQQIEFDYAQAQITFRNRQIKANYKYKILIYRFKKIIDSIISVRHTDTSKSFGFILRSLTIELAHIWEKLVQVPVSNVSHVNKLTEEFISLVAKHHVEHRDLEFYARILGITPKYLTAAIKKASGTSAVEWISNYIILEAKFYLKHTKLNIKEIAYDLNFPTQVEFYSYFKRHTGISPSQYRKS